MYQQTSLKQIQEYLVEMRKVQEALLEFIENSEIENTFNDLISIIKTTSTLRSHEELDHFLHLIINISNNHHRGPTFFGNIIKVLQSFQNEIQQIFSNIELFDIFVSCRPLLLLLLENNFIFYDQYVIQFLTEADDQNGVKLCNFFLPEIKPFVSEKRLEEMKKELSELDCLESNKSYEEKRREGENPSFICTLIRNDSAQEFIEYVSKLNISLGTTKIIPSIYETNPYLIGRKVGLIEYATFCGAIQIVRYLHMNGVQLNGKLWSFAVRSNNAELIRFLEENGVQPEGYTFSEVYYESIKCHHNSIANYVLHNRLLKNIEAIEKVYLISIENFNFLFLQPLNVEILINQFFNFCKYNFTKIVHCLIEMNVDRKAFGYVYSPYFMYRSFMMLTEIGQAQSQYKSAEIVIPSSVRQINQCAFQSFTSLQQIIIMNSLLDIGSCAFKDCKSLQQVIIHGQSQQCFERQKCNLEKECFAGCQKLTEVIIPSSINCICESSFEDCISLKKIRIPSSVTVIETRSFRNCKSLQHLFIEPNSRLTIIGCESFYDCTSLRSVFIPSLVERIGYAAFNNCNSLKKLTFGKNSVLISIERQAFNCCESLEGVINMPSSLRSIADLAFNSCKAIDHISFENDSELYSIGLQCFGGCSSLKSINIPKSTSSIGMLAFINCSSLIEVEIPSNVTEINVSVFEGCFSLAKIGIPKSVNFFSEAAFKMCRSLKEIFVPSKSRVIDRFVFSGCLLLEKVIIPPSVTEIREEAFSNCQSLVELEIPSSVTSIGKKAFGNCSSLAKITIPSSITCIEESAFYCCASIKQITIHSGITKISKCAFEKCSALTDIVFESPSSLDFIDDYAFEKCFSLEKIVIPPSVLLIGKEVFYGCNSINEIRVSSCTKIIGNLPNKLVYYDI